MCWMHFRLRNFIDSPSHLVGKRALFGITDDRSSLITLFLDQVPTPKLGNFAAYAHSTYTSIEPPPPSNLCYSQASLIEELLLGMLAVMLAPNVL